MTRRLCCETATTGGHPPPSAVLTMATMRFADEVVTPSELDDVIPEDSHKLAKRRWR